MIFKGHNSLKLKIDTAKAIFIAVIFASFATVAEGQQAPANPVSYRIFSPFIVNPAIAGSKDFTTIDFASVIQGGDKSLTLSGSSRLSKFTPGYFDSPLIKSYTNIGTGVSFFDDNIGTSHTTGLSAAASYHISIDKKNLSFLSFGAAVKGIYNRMDSVTDLGLPAKSTYFPNIDLGLYLYNPSLSIGFSATNILGNPLDSADLSLYAMPVSRQYFFIAGYKFILSRSLDIVLEPSLIVNFNDSLQNDNGEIIQPMLKLYMSDLCIGTYIHDFDKLSFFFQYKFPGFYIGSFFDFPRDTPFYRQDLIIELALGINFTGLKPSLIRNWHW